MVEQPAPVHTVQGVQRHLLGAFLPGEEGVPQQKDQVVGHGKLGRGAKAAPLLVITLGKLTYRSAYQFTAGCAGTVFRLAPQVRGEGFSSRQHPRPVLPPQPGRLLEQVKKLPLGQVGARPEGLLIRGEQDG